MVSARIADIPTSAELFGSEDDAAAAALAEKPFTNRALFCAGGLGGGAFGQGHAGKAGD
jgi:hypothetical protein